MNFQLLSSQPGRKDHWALSPAIQPSALSGCNMQAVKYLQSLSCTLHVSVGYCCQCHKFLQDHKGTCLVLVLMPSAWQNRLCLGLWAFAPLANWACEYKVLPHVCNQLYRYPLVWVSILWGTATLHLLIFCSFPSWGSASFWWFGALPRWLWGAAAGCLGHWSNQTGY